MTEKRFFMISYSIWDSQNDNRRVSRETAYKLLNKLNDENQLLKQALRELLEEESNAYVIELLDKIFDLKYCEWQKKMNDTKTYDYVEWEKILEQKKE